LEKKAAICKKKKPNKKKKKTQQQKKKKKKTQGALKKKGAVAESDSQKKQGEGKGHSPLDQRRGKKNAIEGRGRYIKTRKGAEAFPITTRELGCKRLGSGRGRKGEE